MGGSVSMHKWMELEVKMGVGIRTDTLMKTADILRLIAEIDKFKGAWSAIERISPDRLTALRHVATIESIGSSTRIKGAKLSDRDAKKLLAGLEIKEFTTRDKQEEAGYAQTMETIFAHSQDIPLTTNHIKQLYRDLLQYSIKDERHHCEYKMHNNHVEAFKPSSESIGIVFETATPFDTPRLIEALINWTQKTNEDGELRPLISIALFVVIFLEIHSFQDGKGRLSRIRTTLLLLRAGYQYVPYSSHERVFERERLILGDLPELSVQILELCREHGRVTVGDVTRVTGASRNTIKDHLKALTKAGHIELHGAGRGTWYSLE